EGHPVRGADGLPRLLLERARVLHGRGAPPGRGGPAARAVPPRDPPRAEPDRQPPLLARHLGPRPRRDLAALVRAARPGEDPRPVRDDERPAPAYALLPGGRRIRGPPTRLRVEVPGVPQGDAVAARPVRGHP